MTANLVGRIRRVARSDFWRRFRRSRNAVVGSVLVLFVSFVAIFAPLLAPHDFEQTNMLFVWAAPSEDYLLGADGLGRDILSRLITGARVSLLVAMSVLLITLGIGVALGMMAAYFGGWADTLIMRTVDIIFAFRS